MDTKRTLARRTISMPTGYRAFVPRPLPPELVWDKHIVNTLSRADYVLDLLSKEQILTPSIPAHTSFSNS